MIGGSDDANVNFSSSKCPYTLNLLILEHTKELRLGRKRHVSDLVQEQRTRVGVLEQTRIDLCLMDGTPQNDRVRGTIRVTASVIALAALKRIDGDS
jgi:hypothetical protein